MLLEVDSPCDAQPTQSKIKALKELYYRNAYRRMKLRLIML